MQWEQFSEPYGITRVAYQLQDGECILTWQWPKDVDYVYIYSFNESQELRAEQLGSGQLKLFTREEYKASNGYRERIDYIGMHGYRIFPCVRRDGQLSVLTQEDEHNRIRVNGGRAKIRYSIQYGNKLFRKFKTVRIQIFCEIQVPQEVLCYVKKTGSNPTNFEDGYAYPFMGDFQVGRSVLPEIEIGKDEYIRLFFAEGKRYGELYELICE
ncbi:hypothetical protein NV379_18830 [Paenibacillus sp. N1-5-1-14]|uniref:hypothetical protein n=1 Tax=Paenibacillus radicibacter TaxID=2972488 RepID=UPI0021597A5A|nr:hypothetical protein [Paenibacillus radicibacter]MCR8644713.1 hypothetical protein [Paenibacillus radicibacter]